MISIGTCVSYTIITSEGHLLGGAISPGLEMRLRSMAEQTANLPLVTLGRRPPLLGQSTEECLRSGAWHGAELEIQSMIKAYAAQYDHLKVFLCGGSAKELNLRTNIPTFVHEELVLIGLCYILSHHQRQ